MWWPDVDFTRVPPTVTPGGGGRLIESDGESVARGGIFEVRWVGGHPGVDLPKIRLEQSWGDGGFSPVDRAGGLPFDDGGFESVIHYRGNYADDHTWSVRWEVPFDFLGQKIRLAIEGQHWTDTGTMGYRLTSAPREILPATFVVRDVELNDEMLSFHINLPDSPSNDDGVSVFDGLRRDGHLVRFEPTPEMGSALRRWAIFLGPSLKAGTVLSMGIDGREFPHRVEPIPSVISRTLVTARDAMGVESTVNIDRWPSHRVTLPRPLPEAGQLFIRDPYGNQGVVDLQGLP